MAQYIADRRDVDFVLHEQMRVGDLSKHERFAEFNKKTVDMIVSEARNLAIKEILPTRKLGDEEGCQFENGKVTVPESFHKAYRLIREGEWTAISENPDWGGQGMPVVLSLAAGDYLVARWSRDARAAGQLPGAAGTAGLAYPRARQAFASRPLSGP